MERGYVTSRTVLQTQDLAHGRLTLTLLPGRIRNIRFAAPDPRANVWNALPAKPGDILNLRDVEQGLENLKRVPTVEADIQIEPGDAPTQSDLAISWQQSFPFRFNATLDDSGSKATGKYQGSATLSHDHWWTLNDLFYVTLNQDLGGGQPGKRGTRGHTVHYSVPMDFWLLGVTQSANRYHQSVAGLNQDYVYSGRSETAEIKLSRLLHRNASQKTSASLKGYIPGQSPYVASNPALNRPATTGGPRDTTATARCANGDTACITGVGQQQSAPLTQQTKEAIADAAEATSRGAGVIAAGATAVAAQGGPYTKPAQVVATGATAIGAAADTVEQIARPDMGKTAHTSITMYFQDWADSHAPGVAPITNEVIEFWKSSDSGLTLETWVNKQWQNFLGRSK